MQEIADCGLELEQKEKPTLRPAQGRLSRNGREKWGTPAGEWRRAVDGVESAERKESYQWAVFGRCAVQSEDQPCLTCLHKIVNCRYQRLHSEPLNERYGDISPTDTEQLSRSASR